MTTKTEDQNRILKRLIEKNSLGKIPTERKSRKMENLDFMNQEKSIIATTTMTTTVGKKSNEEFLRDLLITEGDQNMTKNTENTNPVQVKAPLIIKTRYKGPPLDIDIGTIPKSDTVSDQRVEVDDTETRENEAIQCHEVAEIDSITIQIIQVENEVGPRQGQGRNRTVMIDIIVIKIDNPTMTIVVDMIVTIGISIVILITIATVIHVIMMTERVHKGQGRINRNIDARFANQFQL